VAWAAGHRRRGGQNGAAARVARHGARDALGVLRFGRPLVLVMTCFSGLLPVGSIRCQPVLVIVRFRCGPPMWGSLLGRIGKRIGPDECDNRRNKKAN
jgi:hypothetical protein